MAIDLAKLVVKLELESAQFLARATAAEAKVKKLESTAESSAGKFQKNLNRAIVGAVGAMAALTKHAIDNADKLERVSQATGIATETLSGLQYAAELADVSSESLFKSMQKLAVSATDAQKGTGKAAAAFKALGIDVLDANKNLKSQETLLLEVADSFAKHADGTGKAAAAQAILGKGAAELIPFFNQGAAAIKAQTEEARQFGLIVSGATAKAADQFNDNLVRLEKAATGSATVLAAELLPTLVEMTDGFIESAKQGGTARAFFDLLADTLKGIVSVGIHVVTALENIGRVLGGLAASATLIAEGEFAAAFKTMERVTLQNEKNTAEGAARVARIWAGLPPEIAKTAEELDKAAKKAIIFNPDDAGAQAQKAVDAARDALRDHVRDLQTQVDTFGQGTAAIARYSVAHGELAEKIALAGAEGEKFSKQIVDLETRLEAMKNQEALKSVDNQILALTGHTAEAAAKAYDLQNALLRASLPEGDPGIERIDTLKKLIAEQAKFNELEIAAGDIREDLARVEDQIAHSQEVGAINELEAMAQLSEARQKAVGELGAILEQQQAIADVSANPEIVKATEAAADAVEDLSQKTNLLAEHFETMFEDSAAGPLADFIKGTASAADAFDSFVDSLESSIADFIAKDLLRRMFGGLTDASAPAGSSGGWIGSAAGFIGGLFGAKTMDRGGRGQAGRAYMIGTGAQPEMFVPSSSGNFIPAGAGGMNVTNHFSVSAPGGIVSRRTEQQIAAAAARGVQLANVRGN